MIQNKKVIGYILALVSAAAFGLNPLFVLPIKASSVPLDVTLFYRFVIGFSLIAIFLLIKKQDLSIRRHDVPKLLFMGLMYALSSEFLFMGYDALSAGIASTVLYTYPMILALILYFGFREKISNSTKLSMLLAFLGVAVLGWEKSEFRFNYYGVFIVLMSGLVYSIYMVMVNKGHLQLSGIKITMYSLLCSSFYFGTKSIILGHSFALPNIEWIGFVIAFSLVTTVISIACLVYAITLVGSTSTAILSAFEPIVAVVVSVSLFNEKIGWQLTLGIILVIAAVCIHILGEQRLLPSYHKKISP